MLNEGGCDRLSAGIGNISYVKDLQTETIVTTKFRCSKFSSYHSTSDTHGWVRFKTSNSRTLYQGMCGTSDIVCACVLMGWGHKFLVFKFFPARANIYKLRDVCICKLHIARTA